MNAAPEERTQDSATGQSGTAPVSTTDDTHPTPPSSPPPIPSYEAAIGVAPPVTVLPAIATPIPANAAPADELPDYTPVDSNQTSFMIYGTFIYNPNGPAYQLSSLLDAHISKLRIRRLRAEDIALIEAGRTRSVPVVAFDNSTALYESHDPPFLQNEYYIQSITTSGCPGTLQLRFGFKRWHIRHVMQQGVAPQPFLTCGKVGGLKKRIMERSNEMKPSEWKDVQGRVLATEVLRLEGGKMLPTIELREDLTEMWRELLLTLWVTRLWAGFGAGSGSE